MRLRGLHWRVSRILRRVISDAVSDGSTIAVMEIAIELLGVRVEQPDNTPVMILREQTGDRRLLPILIGTPEATAIHYAIEGIQSPRPLTHDLFVEVLVKLGATLSKVVITELQEHTYYAEIHLDTSDGAHVISGRPSDAVALAVRTTAPLFARLSLLDQVARVATAEETQALDSTGGEEAILDDFRDFIDSINPEDFSG